MDFENKFCIYTQLKTRLIGYNHHVTVVNVDNFLNGSLTYEIKIRLDRNDA